MTNSTVRSPILQKRPIMQIGEYVRYLSPFQWPFSRWTWVSRYQNVSIPDFIGDKDDGGNGDNWNYKICNAPVNRHHEQTNTQFLQSWMPFLSPNQPIVCPSTEGKMGICYINKKIMCSFFIVVVIVITITITIINWSVACINWVSRKKWIWENRHWSCGHANG